MILAHPAPRPRALLVRIHAWTTHAWTRHGPVLLAALAQTEALPWTPIVSLPPSTEPHPPLHRQPGS